MEKLRIAYVLPFKKLGDGTNQTDSDQPKSLVIALSKDQAKRIRDRIQITYDHYEINQLEIDPFAGVLEIVAEHNPKAWIGIGQKSLAYSNEDVRRHFPYTGFENYREFPFGGPSIVVVIHKAGVWFRVGERRTEGIDVLEFEEVFGLSK